MQIRKIRRNNKNLSLDMTPLIDCVFLLLIFFMVGTQLIKDKSGLKIELPTSTVQEVEVDDELVLFIDKDKKMEISFVDGQNGRVTNEVTLLNLEETLKQKLQVTTKKDIVIKADKNISHGDVIDIMTISKNAGAESLDIATDEEE